MRRADAVLLPGARAHRGVPEEAPSDLVEAPAGAVSRRTGVGVQAKLTLPRSVSYTESKAAR